MADAIEDRGDEFVATGDEPGETGDPKDEAGKEPEGDAVSNKGELTTGEEKEDVKEPATKEPDDKDEPRIPKSRFDQAVKKARDAEAKANEKAEKLEAELAATKGSVDFAKLEAEIDTLEEELEEAIKDGNVEAKQRIRREIRAKNSQVAESKAAAYSMHATAVAVEQIKYDALVERMEVEHPELNPDAEDTFDADKVAEVWDLKTGFEAKGEASTAALKKALKYVYGQAKPAEVKKPEEKADEGKQAPDDLKKKADDEAARRKAEAIKKGLDVKDKQPSNEKAGVDSNLKGKSGKDTDINKMSDKDFDKLDDAELKRLRGDNV